MTQQTMTGDDWLSDRDRKSQARAVANRKKTAIACAKKLEAAADSLNELMRACNECHDASSVRRGDDGRQLLVERLMEFSHWLDAAYNK